MQCLGLIEELIDVPGNLQSLALILISPRVMVAPATAPTLLKLISVKHAVVPRPDMLMFAPRLRDGHIGARFAALVEWDCAE